VAEIFGDPAALAGDRAGGAKKRITTESAEVHRGISDFSLPGGLTGFQSAI
jgi:hypothetical protein